MGGEIITIVVAIVLAFIAWKVLMGMIKFGAMAVIGIGAIYFLTQGGIA